MEATKTVDETKTLDAIERGRLTKGFIMTVQIIISLVMFIVVLPFFVLWRVPISFLYLIRKEKEEPKNTDQEKEKEREGIKEDGQEKDHGEEEEPELPPPKDAYERAIDRFNKTWKKFRDLSINKPVVTYWSRIAAPILLVVEASLSLALLEKSLV